MDQLPISSPGTGARRDGGRGPALALVLAGLAGLLPAVAGATTVTIPASKDNTLYENASGSVSNGAGEYVFTGRTKDGFKRRAVMAFDIAASVPAGSTINSVTLQLHLSREANGTLRITTLYRLTADWGEGTSNAGQNEGQGAPATAGDATWLHRFYPSTLWAGAGGDFDATARASTGVTGNGFYTWSSSGMVLDAQGWLDSPSSNFGWLIEGDESVVETSKRFDSRENGQSSNRPTLTVDYTAAGGTGACCLPSGSCSVGTSTQCASQGGTYQGDGTSCSPNPCPVLATLPAAKDNTLYESATGSLSNGAGTKILASKNSSNLLRRGVIQFDLSSIPTGATIQSATLTLYNAEASNSATVSLYRASASWGEGASLATGTEDGGAPPTAGDATWVHRFYPGTSWTTVGGDFSAAASASAGVVGVGSYAFGSAALTADVQAWVNAPSSNFGWVVRGKESGAGNALKRFESRQSTDVAHRPRLDVQYQPPAVIPTGACCLPNGTCDTLTSALCSAAGGTYQGDGSSCTSGLCPLVLTAYADSLPRPAVAIPVSGTPGGAASYTLYIRETWQRLHRDLPLTRVWGYGGSYPGPTIEASTGQPVSVTWVNDLRDTTGALRTTHYLPVDLCLKGPDTEGASPRVVAHLHGGHVPAAVDGFPDSTFLPGQQRTYDYPNHQPSCTLWYHDHAMGITRLNVMMGLAGFYLLRDAGENALGLPSGEFEIPLAIQDRSFNSDGTLQYPATWMDHFFGDKMLVNGKVWPYLRVKQGKYRFRLLNGCTSRALHLALSNGASFSVIGTEQGLLPAPAARTSLLLTPGERADVVMDFAPYAAGTQIVLTNDAPAPYPGNPGEGVIPNVMRFEVIAAAGATAPLPGSLRAVTPLDPATSALTRDLVLRKQSDPCTGDIWTINGLGFEDITERPVLGSTEIWRFINESGISHPMHMHLVAFQILDRQPFTLQNNQIVTTGPRVPPDASEAGWKDTAPVGPNEILRVIARFDDYLGAYPYHCHIIEHEDNEMMRQLQTVAPPTVSIDDVTVAEGHSGTQNAVFTATLSSPVQSEVRVVAFSQGGTAASGVDFLPVTADTLVFPPLTTTQTVTVPVVGDLTDEFDETFTIRLTSPSVAVLGDSVGLGTILDDDAPPTLSVSDAIVAEGDAGTTPATFTVSLSARSQKPIQVLAGTADGTGTAGSDYVAIAPPVVVSFTVGDTALTRSVPVSVLGDAVVEPDETFHLDLTSPSNATLADSSGLGTIVNDDAVPIATVNDAALPEGDAGSMNATFTVTLSRTSATTVRVVAFTEDSTAVAGQDYTAVPPDTLVFPPLTTTRTLSVPVSGDGMDEFDEVFHLRLGSALGAVVGDSIGAGTILDDDPAPELSVDDVSVPEGNADTTLVSFAVSLSARSGKPVQVLAGTADGTATAGGDYVALGPVPLVFSAGDTTMGVTVHVPGDVAPEPDETFFLHLWAPQNALLADSSGMATILNDDGTPTAVGGPATLASYLGPGYPNPSDGRVTLEWGLRASGRAELAIFDVQGRLVRRIVAGELADGRRISVWDGREESGRRAPTGLYLVRLRTVERTFQRTVLLLR